MRLIRDFWNTNACPKGRIGRFTLWLMNISHTPLARWYLSLIQFESHWIVLDVGCGGGKNIARLLKRCPQGKVYGVDYSEESVEMSKKTNRKHLGDRCFIEHGNVLDLPYEKEKFHLVTAYETVYFWGDLEKAFAEVFRVLKPGGLFTFSYAEQNAATTRYWCKKVEGMKVLPVKNVKKALKTAGFHNLKMASKGSYSLNFCATKPAESEE